MPNPLADSFAAACVKPEIRWTNGDVKFRMVPAVNMNAKQRRQVRRWEKKYLPQMMKRHLDRIEAEFANRLSAVAGLGVRA